MCFFFGSSFGGCFQFDDVAVDARAHEALAAQLLDHLRVLAFACIDHRREQQDRRAFGQAQHLVDHLADRLRRQVDAMIGTTRNADAREQQAQVIVNFRDRADRRARVVRGGLLLDRDRRRQALDGIDVRLFHHRQELPRVGRQRLDVAPLAFGVDRVERERGLARPGQPGEHDQPVARQLEVDIAQVVSACAADDGWKAWLTVRGVSFGPVNIQGSG